MALSDWYEIRVEQSLLATQPWLNIWHVVRQNSLISAQEVAQAYVDWIMPEIVQLQSTAAQHDRLVVQNLGDSEDFIEVNLGAEPGIQTGDREPNFVALRIQALRERTDMKHGWKRIGGITEGLVVGNSITAVAEGQLQDTADAAVAGWEVASAPGVKVVRWGIIARICAEVGPAGACLKYRLPENDAELDFYIPTQALARPLVGSQNSRKV